MVIKTDDQQSLFFENVSVVRENGYELWGIQNMILQNHMHLTHLNMNCDPLQYFLKAKLVFRNFEILYFVSNFLIQSTSYPQHSRNNI